MTIDARIPMMGRPSNALASFMQGQEDNKRNQLLDLQIQNQQSQADKGSAEAEMAQLKSQFMPIVNTAIRIKSLGGAKPENLRQISSLIAQSGANPESVQQSVALLEAGDFKGFNTELDNVLAAGRQMGLVKEQKDQSFTLSEGQTRFNAQGQPLASVPKSPANKNFDNATKLRGEFANQSKDFTKQNAAMGRIDASVKDPSAAGDLALIFNYMKLLDPGSTVREGEFATAQNSAGVPQRVVARYNALISGERLGDAQRDDFYSRAKMLYDEAVNQHNVMRSNYRDLATRNNLNPDDVLVDFKTYVAPDEASNQSSTNIPEGFVLMEDASGNKAYVNQQTGEIREVQ